MICGRTIGKVLNPHLLHWVACIRHLSPFASIYEPLVRPDSRGGSPDPCCQVDPQVRPLSAHSSV